MTEKDIRKFINRLNNKKAEESIFTQFLSNTVDLAKVWSSMPKESESRNFSYRFFFIKNELGVYVGAILDMESDLHWYIVPKYRKKGHLSRALKDVVLPFIFNNEREKQRITIEMGIGMKHYSNSKKVALSIGFKPINESETEFELIKLDFNWKNGDIAKQIKKLEDNRIEILKKRVNHASQILLKISDELQMSYHDDKGLSEISAQVKNYRWKIEDLALDNE